MATYVVMVAVLTDKSAPKEDPEVGVITIASLNYIMYQALITALAYVFNMNFKSFLILYSSILFVLVIATVVYYIKKTEKVKQQE